MSIIPKTNVIKALQNLSGYGISHFITILQPIIITPLITRKLAIDEFGTYSLYYVLFGFFLPIISLNFSSFVYKEFHNELKGQLKKYLNIFISISLISFIIVFSISFVFKDFIEKKLELPSISIVYYAIFCSVFLSIINLSKSVLQSQNQIRKFVLINLSLVVSITLMVTLLYYFDIMNLNRILIGFAIIYGVGSLIIIHYILKLSLLSLFVLNKKITRRVLKFCLPLVLYTMTAMIFIMSDRLIINHYFSKTSLAVYSATFQLAFGVSAFGTVLQLAWSPWVFKQMASNNIINSNIKKYGIVAIISIIIYSILYLVFYPIVFRWYYPVQYLDGLDFFYWFIFAGVIQSIYWLINPFLLVLEKNMYFFYITLFSSIFSISFNIYFIDYGIKFLAFVYFCSWLVQLIALIFVIKYWYNRTIK